MQGLASFLDCIAHYNQQDAFYTVKSLVFLVRKQISSSEYGLELP